MLTLGFGEGEASMDVNDLVDSVSAAVATLGCGLLDEHVDAGWLNPDKSLSSNLSHFCA